MSIERAIEYLANYGRANDVMEFETSSATVELAAEAIGCEPARIAKTLSFDGGDRVTLVVCAGDARIANPKYKAAFGCKAKMLSADEAEVRIGHAVGGVCPFGVNEGCDVYLDESLRRFDVVYPACGSSNSAIALTPSFSSVFAIIDQRCKRPVRQDGQFAGCTGNSGVKAPL